MNKSKQRLLHRAALWVQVLDRLGHEAPSDPLVTIVTKEIEASEVSDLGVGCAQLGNKSEHK